MKVKIKQLNENAKTPVKAKTGDFCYDVYAVSEEEIAPNVWKYGLGMAFQIERGTETITSYNKKEYCEGLTLNLKDSPLNFSIDFRPRSSVWKTGMVLSNSCGTIDEFYTGQVFAIFYHVMPNMPRYKIGDRIGQIKIGVTLPMEFEYVDELNETERGDGGFGSSGR